MFSIVGMCSISTAAGAPRDTRTAGSMLGAYAETMVLQQSCVWFEGVHGIEPQHCMLCGSGAIADMQSANCSSNKAATARVRNILLLITSHKCRSFQACKSRSCRSLLIWATAGRQEVERATGIEPVSAAWEAAILPLNHARPVRLG